MECPKCGNELIADAQILGEHGISVEIWCINEECDFKKDKTIDIDIICQD